MAQELDFLEPKITFAEFGIQLMFPQALKHNAEMLCALFFILRKYKNVIDENHDKLIELRHKH